MYSRDDLGRLVESFKWGFFSDRIVKALAKYEQVPESLSSDDESILEEGASFIDMIIDGRKQITSSVYVSNAIESLTLYNKSLSIILDMTDLPEVTPENIIEIFESFKNNLDKMIKRKRVTSKEIARIREFFEIFRELTLADSTEIINGIYESRSSNRWESHQKTLS